jgi:hypothetical protein
LHMSWAFTRGGVSWAAMAICHPTVGLGRLALLARPPFQARHALVDKRGVCGPSGFAAVGGFGGCHRTNSWGSGCQHQMQGTFAPFSNIGGTRHGQRCLSSTPVADGAAGGQERPRKSACKSWSYLAEIVGNQQLAGRGIRTSAGEILKLIDLSASFAASLHCGNPFTTTLAFDHVELTVPILHGDMSVSLTPHSQRHFSFSRQLPSFFFTGKTRDIDGEGAFTLTLPAPDRRLHLDSRVAHVGNSSMVVQVGKTIFFPSPWFSPQLARCWCLSL